MLNFHILLILLPTISSSYSVKPISTEYQQKKLETGWYYIVDTQNGYQRKLDKSIEQYYIDPKPIVSVQHFNYIKIEEDNSGNRLILIQFDAYGTTAWSDATGKAMTINTKVTKLALIIDDVLVYTPRVNVQVTSGVSALNRGNYSKTELEEFEKKIKSKMNHK